MGQGLHILNDLRGRCVAAPGRIAFPESADVRILRVADRLLAEGAAREVLLLSEEAATRALARDAALDLDRHGAKLIWSRPPAPGVDDALSETRAALAHAAELLGAGHVDAVLAGNTATTADVIRAGIAGVGLASGVRTVSGAFVMNKPGERVYLYADCGVVIAPTAKQLVDIAVESVRTWKLVVPDEQPVVAFLSYSTKGSAQHETATKIAEAAQAFVAHHASELGALADGELQFDAAFDPVIGGRKAPGSPVPGRANIFVFPDLGAGNIAYKITQRLGGYEAYGPILQGLAKPFSDLSRGSTVEDILASAYVNLLRARR
jgi:phosphate acetyltransferase